MKEYNKSELQEHIFKRKSTRKYVMTPLDQKTLGEIEAFIASIKPLDESCKVTWKIVGDVKNLLPIKAPHYLMIYSEEQENYRMNVGFMFQQLDLYLSARGLGSCWLGMARPKEKEAFSKDFVIALAFGEPSYSPHRETDSFLRKAAEDVSKGNSEKIEAARFAPSAGNTQNWFFEATEQGTRVYQKVLSPLEKMMYGKMNEVDLGIALAHIYLTHEKMEKPFSFVQEEPTPKLKGLHYKGTAL